MSKVKLPDLRYRQTWLALGALWIVLLFYLSLANLQWPQSSISSADKIYHLLAYGLLAGWFGQLFITYHSRLWLVLCLSGLGLSIEFIQATMPHRWFELYDATANTCGVFLAMGLLAVGCDKILLWFENRVLRV